MDDQTSPPREIHVLVPDDPSPSEPVGAAAAAVAERPEDEPGPPLEQSVLALRETGKSYGDIARRLNIPRAVEAQAAFVRAVRSQAEPDRAAIVQRELGRLELLEQKIRQGPEQDPGKIEQRLGALKKLRSALA